MAVIVRPAVLQLSYDYSDLMGLSRPGFASKLFLCFRFALRYVQSFFRTMRSVGMKFSLIVPFGLDFHGLVPTALSFVAFYKLVARYYAADSSWVCSRVDSVGRSSWLWSVWLLLGWFTRAGKSALSF